MDPTSFGFVAATAVLIIIISFVVFRMYPKETDFEKAYGQNALRLLTEDRAAKTKSTKSKNKAKNGEKKKDSGGEEKENQRSVKPENGLFYASRSRNDRSGSEKSSSGAGADGEIEIKPNRKKQKGKQPPATEIKQHPEQEQVEDDVITNVIGGPLQQHTQQQAVEKLDVAESENGTAVAKIVNDENKGTDVGERKTRKKNRARRVEEHLREIPKEEIKMMDQEETVRAVETVTPLGSEEKKQEKVKPKKALALKDINAEKFQARLNALTELEPEYVAFIANYINDINAQKAKLGDEVAGMRKQIADKDRLVLQCTDKLTAAQKKDSEVALLQKTLSEEKKKYKLFEQTVCTQMSNSAQEKSYLQRKCDQLQVDLNAVREELKKAQSVIHSTPPPVDTKPYQQQIDLLKAELTSSKSRCSQLEMELNQRLQALQQIKNESQNRDRQMEHLSKTNAMLEKRLQDIEGSAKAERDALEMKLQSTMKMAEELGAVTSGIRDEMLQHKENAEAAVQDREKYCEQIRVLNAQLVDASRERENYLNDCAKYSTKLAEMEAANKELSSQLQAVQTASASNNAQCSELVREVELYRKQLVDSEKQHEEVVAKFKHELEQMQEEKEKCQKQMSLDLSKEVAEVIQCRKELEEFRNEYNEKLNHINYLKEEVAKYKKIEEDRQTQGSAMSSNSGNAATDETMKFTYIHRAESGSSGAATAVLTSDNNGAEYLDLEINELKKQNEELREANYKVVEISQQQEAIFKKHLEELKENYERALRQYRSETSKTLSAVLPAGTKLPHLPNPCDTQQFCQWLRDAESALQKKESVKIGKVNSHSKPSKKSDNNNNNSSSKEEINGSKIVELEAKNRRYRAALATLSSHIDAIEEEAVLKEKAYLSEISRLRQEISKTSNGILESTTSETAKVA